MSCSSCIPPNPCGCKKKRACDECPVVDWVPGTACTMAVTMNGCTDTLELLPGIQNCETKTHFKQDKVTGCLEFYNELYISSGGEEWYVETVCPKDIAKYINLTDLADVEAEEAESCDILVYHPECTSSCGTGCRAKEARWRNYHIPDAGDCEIPLDEDGYYHVLVKNECGCIVECRLPAVPNESIILDWTRDSTPDDPDFPWYYGQYNDTINLYLDSNASKWFGKYDLEVTVNYGIQAIKSDSCPNVNFRSMLTPVIDGVMDITMFSSILQADSASNIGTPELPWGTVSLRGSLTFVVPKGKNASLHHEYRLRTNASFPDHQTNPLDGYRVPDNEVQTTNTLRWNASRLNALQVVIRPARGVSTTTPVKDADRDKLDDAD